MSVYELGPLRLDAGARVLSRGGASLPLGPRAVAVLAVLVERHPECVPKAAILDIAWQGSAVEESNLAVQVSSIRKVLAQVPGGEQWIETVPWRGYRFRGPIAAVDPAGGENPTGTAPTGRGSARESPPRDNLAVPATSFIGRERERSELQDRLATARVLTIVGAGGVGKTRLALEIATDSLQRFPDGVWFVELAGIADPRFVPDAVARVLGVREEGGPLSEALRKHLRSRQMLVVLDNCERVRAASAELATAIVAHAPRVTVVGTSREPLGIPAEEVYALEPLSLPAPGADLQAIGDAEAVRLFVARANAQQAGFTLDDSRAATVARVCIDLDGIPLALELAAARMHSLSVEEIAARLGDRFRLLTSSASFVTSRQQTLRAAMDWSHDLLAEDERIVLRRMAVFVDGCTHEAVAAVTAEPTIDAHAAIDVLGRLARRSLVNAAPTAGGWRYRLLETTRAYALDKLDETGETADVRRRHAGYFHRLFADIYEESFHLSDAAWRERYLPELENVRAALAWAFAEGEAAIAIGLAATAAHLLQSSIAQRSEARGWIETALSRFDGQASERDRAQLWLASALIAEMSSLTRVNDTYAQAIELLRRAGDRDGLAHALACGAYSLVYERRLDDAEAALAEARPLLEGTRRTRSLVAWYGATSSLAAARNDVEGSLAAGEAAIGLCRSIGADRSAALLLSNRGEAAWMAGDLEGAQANLREAIALLRDLPGMAQSTAMCICLLNATGVLVERGAHDEALAVARETLPLAEESGLTLILIDHLALRAALAGRYADAARLAGYSDARHDAAGIVRQRSELRARERMRSLLDATLPTAEVERYAAQGAAMDSGKAEALAMRG